MILDCQMIIPQVPAVRIQNTKTSSHDQWLRKRVANHFIQYMISRIHTCILNSIKTCISKRECKQDFITQFKFKFNKGKFNGLQSQKNKRSTMTNTTQKYESVIPKRMCRISRPPDVQMTSSGCHSRAKGSSIASSWHSSSKAAPPAPKHQNIARSNTTVWQEINLNKNINHSFCIMNKQDLKPFSEFKTMLRYMFK